MLCGYIKVWRCDVPLETKILYNVTQEEYGAIITTFKPVIKEKKMYENTKAFSIFLQKYKR